MKPSPLSVIASTVHVYTITVLIMLVSLLTSCNSPLPVQQSSSSVVSEQSLDLSTDLSTMFAQETIAYRDYAIEQLEQFVWKTAEFVEAVQAGEIDKAKALYAPARMHFERSEPVAALFGDLDPRIDARLADLQAVGKGTQEWTGYHRIEYGLWVEQTTTGYEAIASQLLRDTRELRAKVETVEITAELMFIGAVDLLNEVSISKITGEEEVYSHTDLYDFKANIEGAQKIYEIFKPRIQQKDPRLVTLLEKKFLNMHELLANYEDGTGGYKSYLALTDVDTKALSNAVNELGEPLSHMAIVME
jgi:iron uptake system component EfeO